MKILAIVLIIWAFLGGMILSEFIVDPKSASYKQAQIDVLMGKVSVALINHPDGTKTWEWKETP